MLKTLMIAACAAMLAASQAQAVEVTTNAQPKTLGPAGKIGQWTINRSLGFSEFQKKHPECEIIAINNSIDHSRNVRTLWTVIYFLRSAKCPPDDPS